MAEEEEEEEADYHETIEGKETLQKLARIDGFPTRKLIHTWNGEQKDGATAINIAGQAQSAKRQRWSHTRLLSMVQSAA